MAFNLHQISGFHCESLHDGSLRIGNYTMKKLTPKLSQTFRQQNRLKPHQLTNEILFRFDTSVVSKPFTTSSVFQTIPTATSTKMENFQRRSTAAKSK
jgi:hypothetical protein